MATTEAGLTEQPVEQVAQRTAEQHPEHEAHHIEWMRRANTMMATTTAVDTIENTQVMFTANENAAPGSGT